MTVCIADKADGRPCQAHALDGEDFCFTHHPDRAGERAKARKAGGQARTAIRLPAGPPARSLQTADDVRALLSDVISNVIRGEMDGRTANTIGFLAGVTLKAIQISEVEQRLRRIEAAVRPGDVIGLVDHEVRTPEPLFLGVSDE